MPVELRDAMRGPLVRQCRLWNIAPLPDVYAAVMATGIVSMATGAHRYWPISTILAAFAATALAVLVGRAFFAAVVRHTFPIEDAGNPDMALRLFSFVAACAVLAARFQAHPTVTWILGAVGLATWLVLVPIAAHGMSQHRWPSLRDRAHGAWELASVATSGVAIAAAILAGPADLRGLLWFSGAMWALALFIYGAMTWLILWRAATGPEPDVWAPDSWILMGGIAIATLAGYHIHRAALVLGASDWLVHGVRAVTVTTWVVTSVWIPVLVYTGIRRFQRHPRTSPGAWWAMVFPLGMYSVTTHALGVETTWRPLGSASLVFSWVALAAWLVVTVTEIRRAVRPTG